MKNISRIQLRKIFSDSINIHYKIEESTSNPFNIYPIDGGNKIKIFLKNISPAYFKNSPDISRIQVAKIPAFEKIKAEGCVCVPIVYDSDNDSFVIWNPWLFILRINEKQNISIYSRISEQLRVKDFNTVDFKLSNGELVYCVNPKNIVNFLMNFEKYFIKKLNIKNTSSELDLLMIDDGVKITIRSFLKERQILFAVQKLIDYYESTDQKIHLKDAVTIISEEYKLIN